MRYLKTLLVALLAIVTTSAFADNGFVGSEAANGTYYLYNVGAKKFLVAGNSWGTQASFGPNAAMDVVLASLGNGAYSINCGLSNGGDANYLGHANSPETCFTDNYVSNGNWKFVDAGIPGAHAYYLNLITPQTAGVPTYLSYDGTTVAKQLTATDGVNSLWLLLTKQELLDELEKADADNGVDATFLIRGANFGRNDSRNSTWVVSASNFNRSGGANENMCAESWRSAFSCTQELTGVPAGDYTLNAQAALTDYSGTGVDFPVIFAQAGNNYAASPFPLMQHGENSMTQMSNRFSAGEYEVDDVNITVSKGDNLTVGTRGTRTDTWAIFDNFRLTFYGPGSNAGAKSLFDEIEDFMKVPAALLELQTLIDQCKEDVAELEESDAAGLQKAIDAAQAVHDSSINLDEIQEAIDTLAAARAAYNALGVARDLAVEVLNQVPYVLFPADFKWDAEKNEKLNDVEKLDLNRDYKVYKNSAGKYQLASRIAVAALVRLYQFSIADEKTKQAIVARLAELGVENYQDALAQALTKYARLVVESHGVGAALGEQGDKNYSRMYAALEQAGVTDTDAFLDVLLSGASDGAVLYEAPSAGGEVSGNSWTSQDGLVTITRESGKDIVYSDPDFSYYWTVADGEDWTIKVNDPEVTMEALAFNAYGVFLHVDDEEPGEILSYYYQWAWDYSVTGKSEATVHIDQVIWPRVDGDVFFEVVLNDSRDPWLAAAVEKTTSDIYEMLHDLADGYWGFDANFTAHIVDPDLTEGGSAWESTWGGILNSEPLTDSDESTEYSYFDANTWNDSGTMEVDAHQTIQLPAGRYMLTAAGRASANGDVEKTAVRADGTTWKWNTGADIKGTVWEGAFTETGAEDPQNYFQLYATTYEGKTTSQSFLELVGNAGGIFNNGWNDASVFFTMPSTGDVTIGVRAATNVKERWASATRFRLTRLGDATLYLDENETFTTELNWDAVASEMGTWAPVNFVLHKQMEAGKWYSISVPGDISAEQIVREFGEGTQLALPVETDEWEGDDKILIFYAYNPSMWYLMEDFFGDPSIGMMANMPYLIKPAQVKKSNLYNFYDITNTETKSLFKDGKWSYGALSLTLGDDWFEVGEGGDVRAYPNYIYNASFPNDYTIEYNDTLKAFSAVFVPNEGEIVGSFLFTLTDDGYEDSSTQNDLLLQQLNDAIALGAQKAEWYPGLPTALVNAMTSTAFLRATSFDDYFQYLKDVRAAIAEAPAAYKASKAFHALYAQAEALLASDHTELVEGADAAFEKLLPNFTTLFNRQTTAEGVEDITARLQNAIDDYLSKIKLGGIQEGKNYLRNVATGKFLGASNSWGTQASLVEHPEYVTLAKIADGAYTIESQVSNGGESYYLGTNGFMDSNPAANVNITAAGQYYTINVEGLGVVGYDGTSTVLGANLDAADENALWEVISEEDMQASLAQASEENPVDATFLILDPNFGRNNRNADAWVWETTNHNISGAVENFCAESWQAAFTLSQAVTVPNGVYVLNAQAALTDYTNAYDGEGYPVVFANGETSKFIDMIEADRATSMTQLSGSFSAGLYQVQPIVVNVTDGALTVGTRGTRTDTWCIWDNFELTYYGDADIEAVRASLANAGSGEATGITDVNAADAKAVIYTVNGVRVNSITRPGIYVVNGKKVLVK